MRVAHARVDRDLVLPGDTWTFQCWFRDHDPALTSNFTDAVSVTFQ
ncbi:MAG: hypothetical protein GY722_17525 [bacterium]|nr:hypothetical protein [bacterium]